MRTTRQKFNLILTLAAMLTMAQTAWAQYNGTPTTPTLGDDGYYSIGNAAELYGFAEIVNNGNATANAKLTADIVVNENVLAANGDANMDILKKVVRDRMGTFRISGSIWK